MFESEIHCTDEISSDTEASERRTLGGEQASESDRGAEGPEEGVCPCNTPPSTTHLHLQDIEISNGDGNGIRVLKYGVDSLYLGYYIDSVNDSFYQSIQESKSEAQRKNKSLIVSLKDEESQIIENLDLYPAGTKGFSYVLHNANYYLKIFGRGKTGWRPRAAVQIMSRRIQEMGLMGAISRIEKILRGSLGPINSYKSGISRIDIFADLLVEATEFDYHLKDLIRSKTSKRHLSEGNKQLQTLYIGERKASLQCRIYDKVAQLVEDKKGDLEVYLKSVGLDEVPAGKRIIRVEFEIKRETLNKLKLKDIGKLPGSVVSLWKYCTTIFARIVKESKGTHTEREKLHPLWVEVQEAHGKGFYEVKKVKRAYQKPDPKYAWQNVLRALLYFMGVMLVYTPTLPNRRIDAWLLWRDTEPLYNDRNKGSDFGLDAFDLSQKLRDPNEPLELEDSPSSEEINDGESPGDEDLNVMNLGEYHPEE